MSTRLVPLLLIAVSTMAAQVRDETFVPPRSAGRGNAHSWFPPPSSFSFELQQAPPLSMPAPVDSNSPAYWVDGQLHMINSTGSSFLSQGTDQFHQSGTEKISLPLDDDWPAWIEAIWPAGNGVVFAWYHQEHHGVCRDSDLAVPRIGAAVSTDDGKNFYDLGIVLESGDRIDCSAENGYFAGGHGDFSVLLDGSGEYFYFLFTNYGGLPENQGIAVARMAFADRYDPSGRVWKYFQSQWSEPGIHGRLTPIFPVNVGWQSADTDAFWGPSIHWNSYLESYVMLLNHSCCDPGWPQNSVNMSFNLNLSDPSGWTAPQEVVRGGSWYPQILGVAPGETDRVAGRVARFYMYGQSDSIIVFHRPGRVQPGESAALQ